MTLGDMIKKYLETNTMTDFSRESGLSRAYAYMLIKNKNNEGTAISPSIDTVKKVAKGIHMPFDEVIAQLDDNITLKITPTKKAPSPISEEDAMLIEAFHNAGDKERRMIMYLLGLDEMRR